MKRHTLFLYPAAALIFAMGAAFIQATDTCDQKTLKDHAKAALDPFQYDSGKLTRLMYKKKEAIKEIEVPVFLGEKYRFVFNSEAVSRSVVVSIYKKDKKSKSRDSRFTFTSEAGG